MLGDYITERLFDSLRANVGTFVEWLLVLYVMPAVSEAMTVLLLTLIGTLAPPASTALAVYIGTQTTDFFHLGGAKDLLDKTKHEWVRLKGKLDEQAAWPIGIIFGDEKLPWGQHQILAIGYKDNGDGTAELTVWDNNEGLEHNGSRKKGRPLGINFNGDELQVNGFLYDKPVKGIFVEDYSPTCPPVSLNIS